MKLANWRNAKCEMTNPIKSPRADNGSGGVSIGALRCLGDNSIALGLLRRGESKGGDCCGGCMG
jgi:hypothetical protein